MLLAILLPSKMDVFVRINSVIATTTMIDLMISIFFILSKDFNGCKIQIKMKDEIVQKGQSTQKCRDRILHRLPQLY